MRNQHVGPRFATMAARMIRGLLAPGRSHIPLCDHVRIRHLIRSFRLKHENSFACFGHEVWLILRSVSAALVVDLELTLGRLEPFQRLALQDYGHFSFGIGLEFLDWIKASRKP